MRAISQHERVVSLPLWTRRTLHLPLICRRSSMPEGRCSSSIEPKIPPPTSEDIPGLDIGRRFVVADRQSSWPVQPNKRCNQRRTQGISSLSKRVCPVSRQRTCMGQAKREFGEFRETDQGELFCNGASNSSGVRPIFPDYRPVKV